VYTKPAKQMVSGEKEKWIKQAMLLDKMLK